MIGITAFILLFITIAIGVIVGGGLSLITSLAMKARKRSDRMSYWLIGAGFGLILWIIVLIGNSHISSNGPPNAEEYKKMFKLFALVGLTPGIILVAGSMGQIVGLIRGKK